MPTKLCLVMLALAATTAAAETGFTVGAGGGVNVGTPYVTANAGRRLVRASFLEVYLDYSYDRPIMGDADEAFLLEQTPLAIAQLEALGAPVVFNMLPGHNHEDIVLDFDQGDDDAVTPLLEAFVTDVTR